MNKIEKNTTTTTNSSNEEFKPQNFWDIPGVYDKYMSYEDNGVNYLEWPTMKKMLPDLKGLTILDLGCGFGRFIQIALDGGASKVIGVDLSETMLAEAKKQFKDHSSQVSLHLDMMENFSKYVPEGTVDLVVSSYAIQYVKEYGQLCKDVYKCLKPGGRFILSTLHPIYTAGCETQFVKDKNDQILYWTIKDYQKEGIRRDSWLGCGDLEEYHHTVESYVTGILESGLILQHLKEPAPIPEEREKRAYQLQRPEILVLGSIKK
eukprot:gene3964-4958_t